MNPPVNAGDIREAGSIPEWGRSPRGGYGNPLQYSYLENPMDRGVWWATKSLTWLKQLSMHSVIYDIHSAGYTDFFIKEKLKFNRFIGEEWLVVTMLERKYILGTVVVELDFFKGRRICHKKHKPVPLEWLLSLPYWKIIFRKFWNLGKNKHPTIVLRLVQFSSQ